MFIHYKWIYVIMQLSTIMFNMFMSISGFTMIISICHYVTINYKWFIFDSHV